MPTANVPLTTGAQSSARTQVSGSPCATDSPDWQLTQDNWVAANVDSNLYAWWHGTSDTVPSGIPPPPVTSNDAGKSAFGLAQQLVSKAAGVQTFQCQIGSDLNCIAPQGDFCKYGKFPILIITHVADLDLKESLPRWAYFAWVAMSELHQTMKALSASALPLDII